jgi:hypothetical protein
MLAMERPQTTQNKSSFSKETLSKKNLGIKSTGFLNLDTINDVKNMKDRKSFKGSIWKFN